MAKSKTKTRAQVEAMQAKAVRFLNDVADKPDKADDIEDMSVEEYARHKRITIANPRSQKPGARRQKANPHGKCKQYPDKCVPRSQMIWTPGNDVSKWHFRVDSATHVRDAMARFSHTQGIPRNKRRWVAQQIVKWGNKYGIDSANFQRKYLGRIWRATPKRRRKVNRRNPDVPLQEAAGLYREFHGRGPDKVLKMQMSEAQRGTYTALGELAELRFRSNGKTIRLSFAGNHVKVASSPDGKQLYFIGGDQEFDDKLIKSFGEDPQKDMISLGPCPYIAYVTRKAFDGYREILYYHRLGEKGGWPPDGFYNRLSKNVILAGGSYHIEAPGIIN